MGKNSQICFAICVCATISLIKQARIPRGLCFWSPVPGSSGKHQALLCSSCACSVLTSLTEPQCHSCESPAERQRWQCHLRQRWHTNVSPPGGITNTREAEHQPWQSLVCALAETPRTNKSNSTAGANSLRIPGTLSRHPQGLHE